MPTHTPGSLNSSGNDDQGAQTDNLAHAYPNTVDALPGMQFPDMGGGPDANAKRTPDQQQHPDHTLSVNDPAAGSFYMNPSDPIVGTAKSAVPDMQQYGKMAQYDNSVYTGGPKE